MARAFSGPQNIYFLIEEEKNDDEKTSPNFAVSDDCRSEIDQHHHEDGHVTTTDGKKLYKLNIIESEIKWGKLNSITNKAFFQKGDHIVIKKKGFGREYYHHALVTSSARIPVTGERVILVNVAEFSIPGGKKYPAKAIFRERTLTVTQEMVNDGVVFKVNGHYDSVPYRKEEKVRKKIIQRAFESIVCRCRKCKCDPSEECTCGGSQRNCECPESVKVSYHLIKKNCEHWINSLFGKAISFQIKKSFKKSGETKSFERHPSTASASSSSSEELDAHRPSDEPIGIQSPTEETLQQNVVPQLDGSVEEIRAEKRGKDDDDDDRKKSPKKFKVSRGEDEGDEGSCGEEGDGDGEEGDGDGEGEDVGEVSPFKFIFSLDLLDCLSNVAVEDVNIA